MLEKITLASKSKDLNLLEVCVIEAAKKRCTVGEMTNAMEKVLEDTLYHQKQLRLFTENL